VLDERLQAIVLEGVGLEGYQALGGVLDLDILLDEVDRILTAPDDLLDLVLLARVDRHSLTPG